MALGGSKARRYAEAFLELAEEGGATDTWVESLDRVVASLSEEGIRLLANPTFPTEMRRRALEAAVESEPAGVRSLLVTLLERDAITALPAITRAVHDLLDKRAGIEKAVIATAVPIGESERRDIVARLERETEKRLRATFAVDPALQGGLVVRIGDHQVDGSVRTRLATLRQVIAQGT
jgi:F-type H+-transporting ATPase subunit delta